MEEKKLLRTLISIVLLTVSVPASAQITESEIDALVKKGQDIQDKATIEELVAAAKARQAAARAEASRIIDGSVKVKDAVKQEYNIDIEGPAPVKGDKSLYIFISFSMPDAMIKQYLREGLQYKGRVVIRGLIDGSMAKTTTKLASLIEEDEKDRIGIAIDPRAFEAFDIKTVPAIAISEFPLARCEKEDCVMKVGKFDIIYGSVSVKYALEQFAGRGDVKQIATNQLGYKR